MAAKSLGDFIETYKREHGCNPGIIETWYAAIEFAEANKPSHNSDYMKCSDEVLKVINYSCDSVHGRKIVDIIKRHFT